MKTTFKLAKVKNLTLEAVMITGKHELQKSLVKKKKC